MSSSGQLKTERVGRPRSPMSATDLAHDDDDDQKGMYKSFKQNVFFPLEIMEVIIQNATATPLYWLFDLRIINLGLLPGSAAAILLFELMLT